MLLPVQHTQDHRFLVEAAPSFSGHATARSRRPALPPRPRARRRRCAHGPRTNGRGPPAGAPGPPRSGHARQPHCQRRAHAGRALEPQPPTEPPAGGVRRGPPRRAGRARPPPQRAGGAPRPGCNGRIVGVISRHHRRDGLGRLAAIRVDRAFASLGTAQRADLELPAELPDVIPPTAAERTRNRHAAPLPTGGSPLPGSR